MKTILPFRLILLLFLLNWTVNASAQGLIDKITDLMEFKIGPAPRDSNGFQAKVVLAPIAYYEPNTSLGFGAGANLLFKPKGAGRDTRVSNLPVGFSYTLKNQVFFTSGYTVFFPEERWLFRGNLDYSDFPQDYFGIGKESPDAARSEITYQQFLVEPLLLKAIRPKLFVGGGFRYNTFYNSELVEATADLPAGFDLQDSLDSKSVGLEFAATYDTRDNVLNARKGSLTEFTQGFYGEALGGSGVFQLSKLDLRRYYALNKRSVLALNLYGRYAWNDVPIQELSTLGGAELLRGFQENRFRDRLALFVQAEYRWQTWPSIGLVFFAGTGEVAEDLGSFDFPANYYSVGTGVRVLIIPSENINLRFDYAFGIGPVSDTNFYLTLGEAF